MLRGAGFAAAVFVVAGLVRPAAAQVTLGTPGDPPHIALGAGAFDVTPSASNHHGGTAAEFRGEYRFGDVGWWFISPFVGASGTSDGASYIYGGFGFDINFAPNWVLTPNGAVGYYGKGSGTNLGSVVEFRTGAELDYRFADSTRLGVNINHTSNAGIGKHNPGEQSVVLMYSFPLR